MLEHHLFRLDPDGVIFSDSSAIDDAVSGDFDESGLPERQYQLNDKFARLGTSPREGCGARP